MAAIELTKLYNPIYRNVKDANTDYFILNPFDENGNLSLNEMNVIIDLQYNSWNGQPFVFFVPEIQSLPLVDFKVNFSLYELLYDGIPQNPGVFAGNFSDFWDNGFIDYIGGVMSYTSIAIDPITNQRGWWRVDHPTTQAPALMNVNSSGIFLSDSEAFRQFYPQLTEQ